MNRKSIYTAIGAVALGVTLLTQFPTVTPGQSIQSAVNSATAGDTITIEAGTYAEQVTISKPLTLQAQGVVKVNGFVITANNVTVQGFDVTSYKTDAKPFGFRVYSSNCKILNNYIHDTWLDGILLESSSSGCLVSGNKLERTSQSGAEVRGNNHIIQNNEVVDTIQTPIGSNFTRADGADADGFRFFGGGHQFIGNYIHDIKAGTSTNPDPHTDCFQSWKDSGARSQANNVVFRDNICFLSWDNNGNSSSKIFQFGNVVYALAENNISRSRMVAIVQDGSHDIQFVHNTFIGDGSLSWGVEINSGVMNITVRDNIFYHQENGYGYLPKRGSAGLNAGHNCVYTTTRTPPGSPMPGDVWNQNPLFINYAADDFRLQSNSPCLGIGVVYDLTITPTPVIVTPNTPITPSITPSRTPTHTPTVTPSPIPVTVTESKTPTASVVPSSTPTNIVIVTDTVPPSPTRTPTPTASSTPVCYPVYVGGRLIGNFCP